MISEQPKATARGLSEETRRELARAIRADIHTSLVLPHEEPHPPGAQEYTASYTVAWQVGDDERPTYDIEALQALSASCKTVGDGDWLTAHVGLGHFVVVDSYEPQLFDALDSREGDLTYLGEHLFADGGLHPDLSEDLSGIDSHALLINHVSITPAWRGLRLGLLGTGIAIRSLGRGCSFAALDAIQPGTREKAERAASHKRLRRYWSELGFKHWRKRICVLDLGTVRFEKAFGALTEDCPPATTGPVNTYPT